MNLSAPPPQIEHHRVIESGVGACVGSRWQKCHRITPPALALSRRQSLRSATAHSPHEKEEQRGNAASRENQRLEMCNLSGKKRSKNLSQFITNFLEL
jgi:hypothetical protein